MAIKFLDPATVPPIGEYFVDATDAASASNPFNGGAPVRVHTNGQIRLCTYSYIAVGMAESCSADVLYLDANVQKCPFVPFRGSWVEMSANYKKHDTTEDATGDDYPYDENLSWDEGDLLYISTAGLWINYAQGTSVTKCQIYGYVIKAHSASSLTLEAIMTCYQGYY